MAELKTEQSTNAGGTWTPEQRTAIYKTNSSMLVSAAAGSGKTTVMIERVAELIAKNHIPIKRFLIISFTKASASDMKNKLVKKLSSIQPDVFLRAQLDDIMTSDVSNLHSYCARLLKSYFYEVGLDPTFVVIDELEANNLKDKAFDRLFKQKSAENDTNFFQIVDIFAKKRNLGNVKEVILSIYDFLCSIVDRDSWKNKTLNELYSPALQENLAAKIINSHMKAEKGRMKQELLAMMEKCAKSGQTEILAWLQSVDSMLEHIHDKQGFEQNVQSLNLIERLPNKPSATVVDPVLLAEAEALKNSIKERMDKIKAYALCDNFANISRDLVRSREVVKKLFALTDEFEQMYKALKKEKGGLDFNDLEQNTLTVLKNPTLLDEIKSKYDYVLVDEYQDINAVQEEIIRLIAKNDNRFMVGDVKQSIYRFRLCDPEIFLDKYNLYDKNSGVGELVRLNANFRSKKGILDFVNEVFIGSMTPDFGGVDYKKDACLVAGSKEQLDDATRVGVLFADGEEEADDAEELGVYSVENDKMTTINMERGAQAEGLMIAAEIASLIKNGTIFDKDIKKERKIRYSDITILTQSRNAALTKIVKTLDDMGIPVSTDVEDDCLDSEYVFGVKSFLCAVANYKVDKNLFACMFSKLFDFSASELAEIKTASDKKFFYDCVLDAASKNISQPTKAKLLGFLATLSKAREKAGYLSAKDIALDVIKEQNMLIRMNLDDTRGKQALNKFIYSLGDKTVFEFASDTDNSVSSEAASHFNSVKVMTIHKSKGLEFGVVFVVMANKMFNFDSLKKDVLISKDFGMGINYYDVASRYKLPTLAKQAVKLVETRKLLEEQQRLLYVALTRATDYLFVVANGKKENIKTQVPPSPMKFLDFMGDLVVNPQNHQNANYTVKFYDTSDLVDGFVATGGRQIILGQSQKDMVEETKKILSSEYAKKDSIAVPVKTAVTSIAAEAAAEEEPAPALFDDYDGDPSSAALGTLQHKFMEKIQLRSDLDLEKEAQKLAENGVITEDDAKNIMFDGIKKLLSSPDFKNLVESADRVMKEREFYMLVPADEYFGGCSEDSVVVQGIVDLLIQKKDKLYIVDYKSGSLSGAATLAKYKRQLELYARAMESALGMKVEGCYLASLKTGQMLLV